jgi:phosphatidyl-myo-inositol dimannoside synthase
MAASLRVQMLLTDAFGSVGGIAKFNRDFLGALDACPLVENVVALPRTVPNDVKDIIPETIVYDRKAARGKVAFVFRAIVSAFSRRRIDLVICGHLNLLPVAWVSARCSGAPLAVVIHGIDAQHRGRIGSLVMRRLAQRVDAFIAVSRHTAARFRVWSHVSEDRISILPNSVDLTSFRPLARSEELLDRYGLNGCKIIMTLGRLDARERYKGIDEVIDLLPRLLKSIPSLKYLIVGDGTDRPRLETKVRALAMTDHVMFAGAVSDAEKISLYGLSDVYVMPSSGEGFGIALIEAAACGVPVIGSAVDGSREALMDGRLGKLVDPSDADALLSAIVTILTQKKPAGRNQDVEFFSYDNFLRRVDAWVGTMAEAIAVRS